MRINDVIKKPVITEKAIDKGKDKVYVFEVNLNSNKHQIKVALEKLFKVEVANVKTLVRKGKERRVGRKMQTKRLPNTKKAYVTLNKGKIDIIPSSS